MNNMDLTLENREWKEFLFPDIFKIKKGYYNKKPISSKKGTIPFLSATQFNNGVSEFYTLSEIKNASKTGDDKNNHPINEKIFEGNCIAVTNNGSVGYAFYQKTDFTCSHDINPLYLKKRKLNSSLAKFLITTIEKQRICFEYARKWRPMRMVKSKILLPTNSNGEPDYAFMEQYIQQKEQEKKNDYQTFIESHLQELKNTPKTVSLDEKKWKAFKINDIFNFKRGKRLKSKDRQIGQIAYYSATNINNGLTDFISNPLFVEENKIIVTTFCDSYYVEGKFTASDEITMLTNQFINKHSGKFISRVITSNQSKYAFGRKAFSERLAKQLIILPVTQKGEPDYEFMENYMKHLEYKKLTEYLKFKNK